MKALRHSIYIVAYTSTDPDKKGVFCLSFPIKSGGCPDLSSRTVHSKLCIQQTVGYYSKCTWLVVKGIVNKAHTYTGSETLYQTDLYPCQLQWPCPQMQKRFLPSRRIDRNLLQTLGGCRLYRWLWQLPIEAWGLIVKGIQHEWRDILLTLAYVTEESDACRLLPIIEPAMMTVYLSLVSRSRLFISCSRSRSSWTKVANEISVGMVDSAWYLPNFLRCAKAQMGLHHNWDGYQHPSWCLVPVRCQLLLPGCFGSQKHWTQSN